MKDFKVFIDESGSPHKNHPSKYFVLVGCIIEDTKQVELKTKADQIKYKYWDKTSIVFHSEEMGKKVGAYAQFASNPSLAAKFERQLLQFMNTAPIIISAAIVDKDEAYKIGWAEETIVRKAAENLMLDFLCFLYGNDRAHGRIVFESSGVQRDTFYLRSFNRYLHSNWEKRNPIFQTVRQHLTSITFANKLNHDTEMQLADLFSYGVVCKFQGDNKIKTFTSSSYEHKLIALLERKTLKMPPGMTREPKKTYFSKIKGVGYFPKKVLRKSKPANQKPRTVTRGNKKRTA